MNGCNVDVLVYRPGAMLPEMHTLQAIDEDRLYQGIKADLIRLIGVGNDLEHVAVWFRGAAADMFVDEFSALNNPREVFNDPKLPDSGPLPVNEAATLIYHEANRLRGDDLTGAPKVHGPAIITLRRVWF